MTINIVAKYFIKATSRCRKLRRQLGLRQIKCGAIVITILSFIPIIVYYWYHTSAVHVRYYKVQRRVKETTFKSIKVTNIPMKHVPLNEIYDYSSEDYSSFENEDRPQRLMVDTPGCKIPVAMINYEKKVSKHEITCGKRAVFLKKHDENRVQIRIKPNIMKHYLKGKSRFYCCYRYIKRATRKGQEHTNVQYTNCQNVHDGETIELLSDFVNVKCFKLDKHNSTVVIYNDAFAFVKKLNATKAHNSRNHTKYNVLMMGMDSMSLSRVSQTMPRTVGFFKDNFWLGFRGYHKVEDNSFSNLMAAFAGKNISTINELCSGKVDVCNDLIIWSKYKKSGYITAFGEDYVHAAGTFRNDYAFKQPPTDHFLSTFFLHNHIKYFMKNSSWVCTDHATSGQHLLDFAVDFASTYRSSSFFGVFWMNTFSHEREHRPQYADKMLENFFNQLTYTGIMDNTFIIFFSNHGLRFGQYRLLPESYYEERMPALFMWVPTRFKGQQSEMYRTAASNQFKLLTPYDLYNTLVTIHGKSTSLNNYTEEFSEGCPNCSSVFDIVSVNRTCKNIGIHIKWCSCHRLYPLEVHDTEGIKTILHAVSHIKSMVQNTTTRPCWYCENLSLQTIVRIHFYYDNSRLYYVVAFSMTPGNIYFETTVSRNGTNMEIEGSVSIIEAYKNVKMCTVNRDDRYHCVCRKKLKC